MQIQMLTTLGALLLTLPLASCSRIVAHANGTSPEGVPVSLARVSLKDVPLEIVAVGNVEPIESVEVKPRISGQIRSLTFVEGQAVRKGQLLFSVDRDTLNREVAQQQAELDRDTATEQQAAAVAARDIASEKQRRSEAEIATKLGTLGVLSEQAVSQAVSTSDSARASVQADQAAIAAAAGAVKADRARLAQTQLRLGFADVVAPISGRAGAALVKAGNMVQENDTTVVRLLQISPIRVAFGIPEQSLPEVQRLSAAGPLEVEADIGNGAVAKGMLDFVDNSVDATTGTIRLKADFANTSGELWPGQFVHVRLRLQVDKSKVVVPESAVREGLDGTYVWKVESNAAVMASVKVDRSYRQQTADGAAGSLAVLGGGELRPGDLVVTEGQLRLAPGIRVTTVSKAR